MYPDPQRLEDISVALDLLDAKMEDERLDGKTEAVDIRAILELIQNLSLEVSEELDGYQEQYSNL